jgi:hypothetical protein
LYRVLANGGLCLTTKPAKLRSFYPGADIEGDPKRFDVAVDLLIDASHGRILSIDLIQMQLQHKAMTMRTLPRNAASICAKVA